MGACQHLKIFLMNLVVILANQISCVSPSVVCDSLLSPWTAGCQASLSVDFSRQEFWSWLPSPSPRISWCCTKKCDNWKVFITLQVIFFKWPKNGVIKQREAKRSIQSARPLDFMVAAVHSLTPCDPVDCNPPGFSVLPLSPRVGSNSCPLSRWCHPTISSSVSSFSSCPQSFSASGPFPMNWLSDTLSHFSRVWFCSPMDCQSPGPSVHGILQTRILVWLALPSSSWCSQPRAWTLVSYVSCIGGQVLYP